MSLSHSTNDLCACGRIATRSGGYCDQCHRMWSDREAERKREAAEQRHHALRAAFIGASCADCGAPLTNNQHRLLFGCCRRCGEAEHRRMRGD